MLRRDWLTAFKYSVAIWARVSMFTLVHNATRWDSIHTHTHTLLFERDEEISLSISRKNPPRCVCCAAAGCRLPLFTFLFIAAWVAEMERRRQSKRRRRRGGSWKRKCWNNFWQANNIYALPSCTARHSRHCTVIGARMSHWKWRETKLQPSRARSGHQISGCLVSLHFLCDIR